MKGHSSSIIVPPTVIIASPYIYNDKTIDHRDFWNICGRAGRAFVDGEGKILYAIDETRERWQIRRDQKLAEGYFNTSNSNMVEGGLLFVINGIYSLSQRVGVSFEQLLEMVSENDFSDIGEKSKLCSYIIDLIDDGLLAFQEDVKVILVRSNEGRTYLCSPDEIRRVKVKTSGKWPFDKVADNYRFAFSWSPWEDGYKLNIRGPRIETE